MTLIQRIFLNAMILGVMSFQFAFAQVRPAEAANQPCYRDEGAGSFCFSTKEDAEANKQRRAAYGARAHEQSSNKPPANPAASYINCLYRSFGRNEWDIYAFHACLDEGIAFCNKTGLPTNRDYKTSPITGRVTLSNVQCGQTLEQYLIGSQRVFDNEFENYSRSEAVGVPYQPISFDLRKYVGQ